MGKKKVIELRERAPSLPGVEVRKGFTRGYPQGTLAAHLLGKRRRGDRASSCRKQRWSKRSSRRRRRPGRRRVHLRRVAARRRRRGQGRGRLPRPAEARRWPAAALPRTGDDLVLSIDEQDPEGRRAGPDQGHRAGRTRTTSGTPTAAPPWSWTLETGEIVAMASYPTFEPDVWQNGLSEEEYKQYSTAAANRPLLRPCRPGRLPAGLHLQGRRRHRRSRGRASSARTPSFNCEGDFTYQGSHVEVLGASRRSRRARPHRRHRPVLRRLLLQPRRDLLQPSGHRAGRLGGPPGPGQATPASTCPGENPGLVPTPEWRREHFKDSPDPTDVHLEAGQLDQPGHRPGRPVGHAAADGRDLRGHRQRRLRRHPARRPRGARRDRSGRPEAAHAGAAASRRLSGQHPGGAAGAALRRLQRHRARRRPCSAATRSRSPARPGTAEVFGQDDYAWYASYAPYQVAKGDEAVRRRRR